jgi:hypothetical protein
MKIFHIFIIIAILTGALACKRAWLPDIKPSEIGVSVKYDDTYGGGAASNLPVQLYNTATTVSYMRTTNANGLIELEGVPAGLYDISATKKLSPEEMLEKTGLLVEDSAIFNAAANGQRIKASAENMIQLVLKTGRTGSLVLKQVYYTGSHLNKGAALRDQFVEIFNNTEDTLYADGLCFAQLKGVVTNVIPSPLPPYLYPNGAFNWQKSIGMPSDIDANKDYIYTEGIYRVPGMGKQYPVAPGQSFIIAQNAQNHKAPFKNPNGTVVTPEDPSLTVDLSQAEFEVFHGDGFVSDIDNPDIPNMDIVQKQNKDMILDVQGRDGYAIFYYKGDLHNLKRYPDPSVPVINATTTLFAQIPDSLVIDAIDCLHFTPSRRGPKRLPDNLDAGFVSAPAGIYSSQSVIRKQLRTVNGRIILQDTNNSSADFINSIPAKPKAF